MRTVIVTAAAAALLSACATGGGAPAQPALQVSYPDDAQMTCNDLVTEIARMDEIMGVAADGKAGAEGTAAAVGTGAHLATNAAGYAGALGAVPFLGLAANAGAGLMQQSAQAEAERRQKEIETAQMRRTNLNGIYQGKGCANTVAVSAPAD